MWVASEVLLLTMCLIVQQSPIIWAPGTNFWETIFSMDQEWLGEMFGDVSRS